MVIVPWIRGLALAEQSQETGGAGFGLGSAHWRSHIGIDGALAHLPSRGVRHSTGATDNCPFTDVEPET